MKYLPLLIATIIASSGVAGVVIAGTYGYGPLAYLSYNIIVPKQNQTFTISPAYIDLGNLTPGKSGNVTVTASITVKENGTYVIMLLHKEKLEKVFSYFNVSINIDNHNLLLTLESPIAKVNLTSGTYNVKITIYYKVSQHPKGDLHVKKEPILVIHPINNND
ncbi:MAG: hypothetical protein QW250_02630, partial [Sulfolobaceae archaeon]